MTSPKRESNPDNPTAEVRERTQELALMGTVLYGLLLAVVSIIWLILETRRDSISDDWLLVLFLVALRIGASQLDLSSQLIGDPGYFKGVPGRVITWSAVIVFGPIALWLDFLAAVTDFLFWLFGRKPWRISGNFRWNALRRVIVIPVRDTMPAIVALIIFSGAIDPVTHSLSDVANANEFIYATLAKTVISILVMIPLYIFDVGLINRPAGLFSGLVIAARSVRFLIGTVVLFGLPDMAGLAAAAFYSVLNPWPYIAITIGISLIAFLAHRINRIGLRNQKRAQVNEHLRDLSSSLLMVAPDDLDLPALLSEYCPLLFPASELEIRLFPDQVLYLQGADDPLFSDTTIERLENSTRAYIELSTNSPSSSGLAVPIIDHERRELIGGLALAPAEELSRIENHLPTLKALANLIAASVRQVEIYDAALAAQAEAFQAEVFARTYEAELNKAYEQVTQELSLAGQIQNSFLPDEVPDVSGWRLSVLLEPARETSGDYYDFIQLPDGLLGLLIADVTDKGMGSALYMALSRTIIRTFATEFYQEPARVLEAANRRILEDTNSDLFVTVFYAVLDPVSGTVVYCNAGHNPPFLCRSSNNDEIVSLTRTALPLGLFEASDWEQETVQIMPGDILTLYTDGITEAQDETDDLFGEERLTQVIQDNSDRTAQIIEDKLLRAIYDFTQDAPQYDDITLMILQRKL
jgi:serine phosphatase RsbU (regulator of sigma subunit)